MFTSRRLIVYVVLALLLVVGVSSVAAAPASSHEVVRETVSFAIPADQCASLPAGVSVSGTGEKVKVTNTRTMPDGSTEIFISDLVKGTATDSNGGSHTFLYQNSSTETIPPSGQHRVSMTDSFVLSGPGPHFSVGFNWRWTYTPPDYWPPVDNFEKISTRGDPFTCDPL